MFYRLLSIFILLGDAATLLSIQIKVLVLVNGASFVVFFWLRENFLFMPRVRNQSIIHFVPKVLSFCKQIGIRILCTVGTTNILNISRLNALSFGCGLVAAVVLCIKREER